MPRGPEQPIVFRAPVTKVGRVYRATMRNRVAIECLSARGMGRLLRAWGAYSVDCGPGVSARAARNLHAGFRLAFAHEGCCGGRVEFSEFELELTFRTLETVLLHTPEAYVHCLHALPDRWLVQVLAISTPTALCALLDSTGDGVGDALLALPYTPAAARQLVLTQRARKEALTALREIDEENGDGESEAR